METIIKEYNRFKSNYSVQELSGAFGDLGTLLPILLTLSIGGQVSLENSLIFGGIFNIGTGYLFRIPMCVQPMKGIAAVAILTGMSAPLIMLAGLQMGVIMLILGMTLWIQKLGRLVPMGVLRGVQAGVGFMLAKKGYSMLSKIYCGWGFNSLMDWCVPNSTASLVAWLFDNYFMAIGCFAFVIYGAYRRQIPVALLLALLGFTAAFVALAIESDVVPVNFSAASMPRQIASLGLRDWTNTFLTLTMGQVPLTLLNSVILVSLNAQDLFASELNRPGDNREIAPADKVARSVGIMNLIGPWFGSMPYCHGSGGLVAQYRFGARTEVSVVVLGALKIVAGLCCYIARDSIGVLLDSWSSVVLAIMIIFSGVELALVSSTQFFKSQKDATALVPESFSVLVYTVTFLTVSFFENLMIGTLLGSLAWFILTFEA